ncbi:MAG: nucleotidyltransferase family protein [Candidatus Cloacimonetes bacterium]|nr:nucleotidyltransferase family protein [Candidatus Cloacimonadota bacterium]
MNNQERHLLHAILDKSSESALSHFESWLASINFEEIEGGSYRLIPALYKRISLLKPDFPHKNRMKGIYRYFLYKNNSIMHNGLTLLDAFSRNNIDCILLKGAALITSYYGEPALRPMNDLDILVRREDAQKAFSLMEELGWKPRRNKKFLTQFKRTNGIAMSNGSGFETDLHWDVVSQSMWKDSEKSYWENYETVEYKGRRLRILNPEMQIIHNTSHGLKWNKMSSIRWIPDVALIIEKRRDDIDWDCLMDIIIDKKLVFTMKQGLNFLVDEFGADIPVPFLNRLNAIPDTAIEKKLYYHLNHPSRLVLFKIVWYVYSKGRENASLLSRLAGLPAYLKAILNLDSYSQVFRYIVKKSNMDFKKKIK